MDFIRFHNINLMEFFQSEKYDKSE